MTGWGNRSNPPISAAKLVREYRILIDTNILMGGQINELVKELRRQGKQAIVPLSVYRELERLSQSDSRAHLATGALQRVQEWLAEKVLELRGEPGDPRHADDVFVKVCRKFAGEKRICVLTRDRELEKRLRDINSPNILVLAAFPKPRRRAPLFKLSAQITQVPNQRLGITSVPGLHDVCYEEGRGNRITLRTKIAEGGEGIVYQVNKKTACKIYRPDRLTQRRVEKLRRMVQRPVRISGVCWPRKLVCNQRREVVGYTMPLASGKPVQQCVYIREVLEESFPYWKREHLVSLARCWLEKVVRLHQENVLLGDINPQNFLVVDETNVWFVDCDSYQIEEFPCPVGTVTFTPPELQGKNFATFLRNFEHEHFAVATFLFMLLLPGKSPYSHTGGEDPKTNIREGNFPYTPLKRHKKRKDRIPLGLWRYMWSHLPDYLQEAFYQTFTSKDPCQRLTSFEWLELLDCYEQDLLRRRLCPTGAGSEIYPNRLRVRADRLPNGRIGTNCAVCGKKLEYSKEYFQKFVSEFKGYCSKCRNTQKEKKRKGQQHSSTSTPSSSTVTTTTASTSSPSPPEPDPPWGCIIAAILGVLLLLGVYFLGCRGPEPTGPPPLRAACSFSLAVSSEFSPDALGSTGEYYVILEAGQQQWRIPEDDYVSIVSGKQGDLGNLILELPANGTITVTATLYEEDLLLTDELGVGRWTLQVDPQKPISHQKIEFPGGNTLEISVQLLKNN